MVIHQEIGTHVSRPEILIHPHQLLYVFILWRHDPTPVITDLFLNPLPVWPVEPDDGQLLNPLSVLPVNIENGRHVVALQEDVAEALRFQKIEVGCIQVVGIAGFDTVNKALW